MAHTYGNDAEKHNTDRDSHASSHDKEDNTKPVSNAFTSVDDNRCVRSVQCKRG